MRVFVSFDFDNDRVLKDFILGQAKKEDSPFEVIDHSLKEAAPERDWEKKARAAIARSGIFDENGEVPAPQTAGVIVAPHSQQTVSLGGYARDTNPELAALLEAWEPVRRAVPRWECFDMPGQEFAPDLIIEPAAVNGYPWGFCRRQAGPSTRILDQDSYAGGREQGFNGVHRNPAFFAANVSCGAAAPSLTDITPTVLGLFGLPAEGLDGSDLLAAGKKSFPSRSNKGLFPESAKVHRRLTPREEAELEDRLRRMGYLD